MCTQSILIKFIYANIIHYKVNRCLGRYSPRALATTNQPTNSALNEPAKSLSANESIFWGKNILIILGASKSSVTNTSKNLVCIVLLVWYGTKWNTLYSAQNDEKSANFYHQEIIFLSIFRYGFQWNFDPFLTTRSTQIIFCSGPSKTLAPLNDHISH